MKAEVTPGRCSCIVPVSPTPGVPCTQPSPAISRSRSFPSSCPTGRSPRKAGFFWAYTIEVANLGRETVQLVGRHWVITDGVGKVDTVSGLGVVGQQPVLNPGDTFRYTSGCPLTTPSGVMSGHYRMTDEAGRSFEVEIPAFSLDSPHVRRVLN